MPYLRSLNLVAMSAPTHIQGHQFTWRMSRTWTNAMLLRTTTMSGCVKKRNSVKQHRANFRTRIKEGFTRLSKALSAVEAIGRPALLAAAAKFIQTKKNANVQKGLKILPTKRKKCM